MFACCSTTPPVEDYTPYDWVTPGHRTGQPAPSMEHSSTQHGLCLCRAAHGQLHGYNSSTRVDFDFYVLTTVNHTPHKHATAQEVNSDTPTRNTKEQPYAPPPPFPQPSPRKASTLSACAGRASNLSPATSHLPTSMVTRGSSCRRGMLPVNIPACTEMAGMEQLDAAA